LTRILDNLNDFVKTTPSDRFKYLFEKFFLNSFKSFSNLNPAEQKSVSEKLLKDCDKSEICNRTLDGLYQPFSIYHASILALISSNEDVQNLARRSKAYFDKGFESVNL